MRFILLILTFVNVFPITGQTDFMNCTDSTYCVPAIVGLPRSKGLEIKQERVFNYKITSNATDSSFAPQNATIDRNRRWTFRLRFPVLLKENLKMAVGLSYDHEEFRFKNQGDISSPFYNELEDKSLRSVGAAFYLVKPFLGNKYIIARASAKINGDYQNLDQPSNRFMKYSAALMYGVKLDSHRNIAFGASVSYTFGRRTIYPILAYNHTFSNKWGFESLLPIYARMRYRPNEHNQLYLKAEMAGANYNITLSDVGKENLNTYYLEKSEVRVLFTYEREIHDWLWFGVESGFRTNIGFDLSDDFKDISPNIIIDNELNNAFLANFSIFIVPPKKWANKAIK